jgi:hypothetical protein
MTKFADLELAVDMPSRMFISHPIHGTPIAGPDGNPAWIDLLSIDSTAHRAYDRKVTNSRLERASAGQGRVTAEQLEQEAIERLAILTKDWLLLSFDGTPIDVPCSEANARELYAAPAMTWLRSQVEAHVARRQNFTRAKSNGS